MTQGEEPTHLRIEHGPNPLGVSFERPRLSWWLPSRSPVQSAFEIEATVNGVLSSSGSVSSNQSILRPWPFSPLNSRSLVCWRVRIRSDDGWSGWSESSQFETGLLSPSDWQAKLIGLSSEPAILVPKGERPAVYFQRSFSIDSEISRARIYATAHGLYEIHLDGTRIGDLELTPGCTAYRSHLEFQTFDLTDRMTLGVHTLTATLTDGWWRGSTGFTHHDCCYGTTLAFLSQLELTNLAGDQVTIGTDDSWSVSSVGNIVAADLMEGQRVDQRIPFPPQDGWGEARVVGGPDGRLTSSPAPSTRRIREYRPVGIHRIDDRNQVVDFGANINGWIRLNGSVLGKAGNRVRLRHGEHLGDDGDVDTSHLASHDYFTNEPIDVGQIDEVTSAGDLSCDFEPRHTTHGFQYVAIEGATEISPSEVTGILVHTDMTRTGWFHCSDERLNALHQATVLSFVGNACEIPTDCPTRERSGFTGDWQIFIPTAAFLYDVAGFSSRWLRDLAADQWSDGRVPNFVPDPFSFSGREKSIAAGMTGSAGWGDAAVYVPHELWQSYGDVEILHRQYDSMKAWVEFGLHRAAMHRHPNMIAIRPEPASHERYLWDIGFHWGEWLEPDSDPGPILRGEVDVAEVATAYLYRSLCTVAHVADLIGRVSDVGHYQSLAVRVREAWRAEFIDKDGSIKRVSQANLVRALAFGLVDDSEKERVAVDLVKLIRDAETTVGTGFLATPFLLPVLADSGYADVAYDLLLQNRPPSWLHMIEAGSTTVWENWEGVDRNRQGSLNHYSKGAVASFLHQYVAGLRPIAGQPAYRCFEVCPLVGGGLTHARADLDTPYGPVGSAWRVEGRAFELEVKVAPGTEAGITLPDGSRSTCGPGHHRLRASLR
jgi:alpha-L-rhamnosidase